MSVVDTVSTRFGGIERLRLGFGVDADAGKRLVGSASGGMEKLCSKKTKERLGEGGDGDGRRGSGSDQQSAI